MKIIKIIHMGRTHSGLCYCGAPNPSCMYGNRHEVTCYQCLRELADEREREAARLVEMVSEIRTRAEEHGIWSYPTD